MDALLADAAPAIAIILIVVPSVTLAMLLWRRSATDEGRPLISVAASDTYWIWLGGCLVVLAFAFLTLNELDGLLKGMRVPGRPSGGMSNLGGELAQLGPAKVSEHADGIIDTWSGHANSLIGIGRIDYTTGKGISALYLLLDSLLFVPFYVVTLGLLLRRGHRRLQLFHNAGGTTPSMLSPLVLGLTTRLLVALAIIDVSENVVQWAVVSAGWQDGVVSAGLAYALKALTASKWAAVGAAALLLLAVTIPAWRGRRRLRVKGVKATRRKEAVAGLRIHAILVASFAGLLLVPEQAWDIPRGWGYGTAAVTIALTLLFSWCIWELGRRLVREESKESNEDLGAGAYFWPGLLLTPFFVFRLPGGNGPWGIGVLGLLLLVVGLVSRLIQGGTISFSWARLWEGVVRWAKVMLWHGLLGFGIARGPAAGKLRTGTWRRVVTAISALTALGAFLVLGFVKSSKNSDFGNAWSAALFITLIAFMLSLSVALKASGRTRGRSPNYTYVRALAVAPLIVLGLAIVRSSVGHFAYAPGVDTTRMASLFLVGAVGLPGAAALILSRLPTAPGDPTVWRRAAFFRVVMGLSAFLLLLFGILRRDGLWVIAERMGVDAIVVLFLTLLLLAGSGIVWLADRVTPPAVFRVLGLARLPVFTLLLAWMLLASQFDRTGFHDIRRLPGPVGTQAVAGIALEDAFLTWVAKNPPVVTSGPQPVQPLVMVAASGGGIRAAYWTTLVLDCLMERSPPPSGRGRCLAPAAPLEGTEVSDRIFAASGISGGSLGLASYASYLSRKSSGAPVPPSWVKDRLDRDFLSASMAWFLFVEGPRALLRFDPRMDRAEVLERAWQREWREEKENPMRGGFLALARAHPEVPFLLLNGATVAEGCRFTSSILNGGVENAERNCLSAQPFAGAPRPVGRTQWLATTYDLVDFLCDGEDIRLSTAALLSARFPIVSPTGRVKAMCAPSGPDGDAAAYVVDGGYFDTSATSPLVETSNRLDSIIADHNASEDSCVVPFFVQIDNGYEIPDVPPRDDRPQEFQAPLTARGAAPNALIENAKQAAAVAFTRPYPLGGPLVMKWGWPLSDRYAHIFPQAHPGVQAPLGWDLSGAAVEDLRAQLESPDNQSAVTEVRDWDPALLTCAAPVADESYEATYPLGQPLNLTEGWHVTDTSERLSLFRENQLGRVAVSFLPGASVTILDRLGIPLDSSLAGFEGHLVDLPPPRTTQEWPLVIGDPLRFEQMADDVARVRTFEGLGGTVVVAMTSGTLAGLTALEQDVSELLRPLAPTGQESVG